MKNRMKEKLEAGGSVIGTFFELGGMTAVECLGIAGLDFLVIDTEHGPFDVESAMDFVRMAELKGITPLVRIKEVSRAAVLKMLDVGAQGLIIPCVESAEEVRRIVGYGKYAPLGSRGFIYARPADFGFADFTKDLPTYFDHCNNATLLIPQCETLGCLESIEEIMGIDGVGGIFIGPYDLSIAMGIPGQFAEPVFQAALQRILKACHGVGKPCFIYAADGKTAKKYVDAGYAGVAVNMDAGVYISAFRALLKEVRSGSGAEAK